MMWLDGLLGMFVTFGRLILGGPGLTPDGGQQGSGPGLTPDG